MNALTGAGSRRTVRTMEGTGMGESPIREGGFWRLVAVVALGVLLAQGLSAAALWVFRAVTAPGILNLGS